MISFIFIMRKFPKQTHIIPFFKYLSLRYPQNTTWTYFSFHHSFSQSMVFHYPQFASSPLSFFIFLLGQSETSQIQCPLKVKLAWKQGKTFMTSSLVSTWTVIAEDFIKPIQDREKFRVWLNLYRKVQKDRIVTFCHCMIKTRNLQYGHYF